MVVQEPNNLIKLCLKEFGAIVKPVFSHVYGHGYQHSSLLVGILIELQQPEVTTGSKAKHPAMSQGIAQFYDTLGFDLIGSANVLIVLLQSAHETSAVSQRTNVNALTLFQLW